MVSQPISVPTAAEVNNGDFSAPGVANGVLDPPGSWFAGSLSDATVANILQSRCGPSLSAPANAAVASVAAAGAPARTARFSPTSRFPRTCFDPVAVSLLQYVPGAGGSGNVQVTPNKTDRGDQFQIRVDHSFTNNQKSAIYYYFDDDNALDPFAKFQASGATTGNFPGVYATRTQQINVTHTSTIGSTAVNEARFSYFREGQLQFDTPTRMNAIQSSCGGAAAAFCFTGTSDTALVDDAGTHLAPIRITDFIRASARPVRGAVCYRRRRIFYWQQLQRPVAADRQHLPVQRQLQQDHRQSQPEIRRRCAVSKSSTSFSFSTSMAICILILRDIAGWQRFGFFGCLSRTTSLGLGTSFFQGSAQHELVRSTSLYLFAQDSWKIKPN